MGYQNTANPVMNLVSSTTSFAEGKFFQFQALILFLYHYRFIETIVQGFTHQSTRVTMIMARLLMPAPSLWLPMRLFTHWKKRKHLLGHHRLHRVQGACYLHIWDHSRLLSPLVLPYHHHTLPTLTYPHQRSLSLRQMMTFQGTTARPNHTPAMHLMLDPVDLPLDPASPERKVFQI